MCRQGEKRQKTKVQDFSNNTHSTMDAAPMPSSSPEGPPHSQSFQFSSLGETKPLGYQDMHAMYAVVTLRIWQRKFFLASLGNRTTETSLCHRAGGLQFELLRLHTMRRERNKVVKKDFITGARTRHLGYKSVTKPTWLSTPREF